MCPHVEVRDWEKQVNRQRNDRGGFSVGLRFLVKQNVSEANSRWLPKLIELNEHEMDHNSVNVTVNEFKVSVVVADWMGLTVVVYSVSLLEKYLTSHWMDFFE